MMRLLLPLITIFLLGCGPTEEEQRQFSGKLEGKVISKVIGTDGSRSHEVKIQFSDGTQLKLHAARGMWVEIGVSEK